MVKSESVPHAIHFAPPPEFGGLQGRWTPESLLLGAIATCFTTTFRALAEYSHFECADLEVEVTATIQKAKSGYTFSEITIRPKLFISGEREHERGMQLLRKAMSLCLVSRAISTKQLFKPKVQAAHDAASA
jgi:organic hydroperoxide reductase OsmC/OhrA